METIDKFDALRLSIMLRRQIRERKKFHYDPVILKWSVETGRVYTKLRRMWHNWS